MLLLEGIRHSLDGVDEEGGLRGLGLRWWPGSFSRLWRGNIVVVFGSLVTGFKPREVEERVHSRDTFKRRPLLLLRVVGVKPIRQLPRMMMLLAPARASRGRNFVAPPSSLPVRGDLSRAVWIWSLWILSIMRHRLLQPKRIRVARRRWVGKVLIIVSICVASICDRWFPEGSRWWRRRRELLRPVVGTHMLRDRKHSVDVKAHHGTIVNFRSRVFKSPHTHSRLY